MSRDKLALIAGGGDFPFLVARGAKRAGLEVVCLGIRGIASKELAQEVDTFAWVNMLRLGQWLRVLKREDVQRVIIGGKVEKSQMYQRFRWLRHFPDRRMVRIWYRQSKDRQTNSLLMALADELAQEGITMEDSVQFCQDDMAPVGPLGEGDPSKDQAKDIAFGWKIAKAMGGLDIGQSICVRELEVIAVEAIEGTDQTIRRAGEICKVGGFTVIKVAKPNQDMRFDMPTIGPETLKVMHQSGGTVLAVEAGKTVVLNRHQVGKLAKKYGIVVVGVANDPSDAELTTEAQESSSNQ